MFLNRFETMLTGTSEEADEMLKDFGCASKTANELAQQLIIMKRLLHTLGRLKNLPGHRRMPAHRGMPAQCGLYSE